MFGESPFGAVTLGGQEEAAAGGGGGGGSTGVGGVPAMMVTDMELFLAELGEDDG
jgi:hypothetical protein